MVTFFDLLKTMMTVLQNTFSFSSDGKHLALLPPFVLWLPLRVEVFLPGSYHPFFFLKRNHSVLADLRFSNGWHDPMYADFVSLWYEFSSISSIQSLTFFSIFQNYVIHVYQTLIRIYDQHPCLKGKQINFPLLFLPVFSVFLGQFRHLRDGLVSCFGSLPTSTSYQMPSSVCHLCWVVCTSSYRFRYTYSWGWSSCL